jgi:hypothetical protein
LAFLKTLAAKLLYNVLVKQLPMTTIYLALKLSALIITFLLPLRRTRLRGDKNNTELSDWVVTDKGELVNLAEDETRNHPIKIKH